MEKINLLSNELQKYNENVKIWYIFLKIFEGRYAKNQKHHKVRNHCYYTGEYRVAAYIICNLKFNVLKKIPILFCNGSKGTSRKCFRTA